MNENKILADDPRLTAYALGEMTTEERSEFEQRLAQDVAAQHTVAEIRAAAETLTHALGQEPAIPMVAVKPKSDPYAKVTRFPYWQISGLAAACFTVFFIYSQQQHEIGPEKKHYVEVPLAALPSNRPSADGAGAESTQLELGLVAQSAKVQASQNQGEIHFSAPVMDAVPPAPVALKAEPAERDEIVALSPFVVAEAAAPGSVARSTLAGARHRSEMSAAPTGAETYAYRRESGYLRVADQPLSTFSIDVDTASYANVRRFLMGGQRPPVDAVRVEEMINYFPYEYAGPESSESRGVGTPPPFKANLEVAGAPWAPEHRLVRIGLKGRDVSEASRPAANLVFLLDVSGSMNAANKLPLLKQSLRLLVEKLRPDDRVAIAVYAGASGLALPSTPVAHKAEILDAIDRLEAEGSTNGAMGIHLAYEIAKAHFIPGGVNRVLLATDGDFNVGVTGEGELVRLIEEKAKSGVFLSVLGFGMGNLKDGMLEQLADKGNGHYAYIDTLQEAKKTLVEQAGGTLVTIAKDVKIQVEFNSLEVQAYRLIGYENRLLAKEDFNNDRVDAGEIGAGHTVTALYEIVPVGVEMATTPGVDELKYQRTEDRGRRTAGSGELLTVKIRYKEPAGEVSNKLEFSLRDRGQSFAEASQDFKFAAAVAGFGMILRDSPHKGSLQLADVAAWGRAGTGRDPGGYRAEFIDLVERAGSVVQ